MCNFVSFVIVGVALTVACVSANTPIKPIRCGPNEQIGNCGRICEKKCGSTDMSECAATSCAGGGCQCKPDFHRNPETGLCVSPKDCPAKCQKGEILAACGHICEGNCVEPWRPRKCQIIKCGTLGCQCDLSKGWVRNRQTGKCERNQDSKNCRKQIRCPANSEPRLCGGVCEASCSHPEPIQCKLDPKNCTFDCHCKKNYVRNHATGKCVLRKDCPRVDWERSY